MSALTSHDPLLASATHHVYELLDVGSREALLMKIAGAVVILLATVVVVRLILRWLARRLEAHDNADEETIRGYRRFVKIVVAVIGISLALHALGLDLTHAFTAGGLLAVALAFAMKNLSENLVSGLILRAEHIIQTGDILELEGGRLVRVDRIGMRATTVRTKQEQDLILPNADLVQSAVVNFTHRDSLCRIDVTIPVAYTADLEAVRSTLEEVCAGLDWQSERKPPQVRLQDLGESSLDMRVLVWMEDPWRSGSRRSELLDAIWRALQQAGIQVPFPQLDVHVRDPRLPEAGVGVGA